MVFCTDCGKENPEDAKFCLNCGKEIIKEPLIENSSKSPSTPKEIPKEPNKHNTAIALGWLGILIFIPLTIVIGIYLLTCEEQNAKKQGLWMLIIGGIIWIIGIILILSC